MIGAFEFENDGKKYSCAVEQSRFTQDQPWWWFQVSGDTHRYAPFQALASDTRQSVRSRVVAYYTNHIARRAAPPPPRGHWARRQAGATPAGSPPAPGVTLPTKEIAPATK
jgi:hypothetical protein